MKTNSPILVLQRRKGEKSMRIIITLRLLHSKLSPILFTCMHRQWEETCKNQAFYSLVWISLTFLSSFSPDKKSYFSVKTNSDIQWGKNWGDKNLGRIVTRLKSSLKNPFSTLPNTQWDNSRSSFCNKKEICGHF